MQNVGFSSDNENKRCKNMTKELMKDGPLAANLSEK